MIGNGIKSNALTRATVGDGNILSDVLKTSRLVNVSCSSPIATVGGRTL